MRIRQLNLPAYSGTTDTRRDNTYRRGLGMKILEKMRVLLDRMAHPFIAKSSDRTIRPKRKLYALIPIASAIILTSCSGLTSIGVTPSGPSLSSISPNYGTMAGGTQVVINGSGFTGATSVEFGSTAAASFSVVSDSEIKATTPQMSSANAVEVVVTTSAGSSKRICIPIIQLPGCAGTNYYFLKDTPWNISTPVNLNNIAVPIPGASGASLLVSATGGTLTVNGSLGYSVDENIIPSGFVSSGTVSISNLTVTFKGQLSTEIEVPLPLGLPYGLDVYVTINPSLQVGIPITLVLNASWTYSAGLIDGSVIPATSTLTCKGVDISSLVSAFGTCIDASATTPSLSGASANLVTSPFWLQVGPSGLDAAIGPQVGISAGVDSVSNNPYWEVCAGLGWQIQAAIINRSGNLLGPVSIAASSQGNPKTHCPMGTAS